MILEILPRVFRPDQQDWQILLEDAFGIRRAHYVGIVPPPGGDPIDVEAQVTIKKDEIHLANEAMVASLTQANTSDSAIVGRVTGIDGRPVVGQSQALTFAEVKARHNS